MPHRLARQAAHRLWALRRNTLALLFWLLFATAISGLVMLFALVVSPERTAADLGPGDEVFAARQLDLDLPPLRVHTGEVAVVPLYHGRTLAGVLLIGGGTYLFAPEGEDGEHFERQTGIARVYDSFTLAFVGMSEQEFRALGSGGRLEKLEDRERAAAARDRAAAFLSEQAPLLEQLPAGVARQVVLSEPARPVLIVGETYGRVQLTFSRQVSLRFVDLDQRNFTFANPATPAAAASPLVPGPVRPSTLIVFTTTLVMLLMLVYVLTADIERPAAARPRSPATASELRMVAVLLGAEALTAYAADAALVRAGFDLAALYLIFAGIVLTRPVPQRLRFAGVGLSTVHLPRAALVGAVVGILGYLAATLELPAGLRETAPGAVALTAGRAFLLTGLAVELYRRGFVQTALERRFGRRVGLFMTAFLIGAVHALPRIALTPASWLEWTVQGVFILPLTELLFGYMYDRTGTVVAGTVARGLLELLTRLLG